MIVCENLINYNEMTRPGKNLYGVLGIVVHALEIPESYGKNYMKYIENLKYQSNLYLSYHYIIQECGKITMIVPETEISYHTPNNSVNKNSIGIGVLSNSDKAFNFKQEKSLKYLLRYMCAKYQLNKHNIFLPYDLYATRKTKYYIDNYFEWENIKEI